ncbi:restriction endonuclease subunit S [Clostridium sp. HV4-5-A1G]|uniref:restriction endonuclease subunit S n=1 Tax=Clostridium sp. HV4-5-A1G TaxID=2004595 RepID=UPI001238B4E4|nr:restriction endonuclease subunit S [Clostridium sp. HV4-5-A1G]KAA8668858.1 restriction endonuclease subunit S [Clostridium sp. HV4-5-A1G]
MDKNKANVPKIRFPGFTNPWEQRKLKNIVDVKSGRDYKHLSEGKIPVYGTGGYMLSVNEALSYKEDAIGIGRKGTIDKPYILRAPFWTVDTLFYAVPENNNNLNFVYDIFQNIKWKQKDESTGVPSLSKTAINNVDVLIPDYKEQKQIGDFFQDIDHLITLHQRKLNHLKDEKKGLLQKMFPKKGENFPELRFPGFTDPWEQRKLKNIAEFNPKSTLPDEFEYVDLESVNGTDLISHRTEIKGNAPSRAQRLAKRGDVFYQTVRPYQKNNYLYDLPYDNYVFSTGYAQMRPNIDSYFLLSRLQEERFVKAVLDRSTGTSYPAINSNDLSEIEIKVPFDKDEQFKIGSLFRDLDNLITLHQRKLNHLKEQKEALLQQMFI